MPSPPISSAQAESSRTSTERTGGFDVSVVIPSWNGWKLLRDYLPSVVKAAESYRNRSGGRTEIIVVDDGSQDQTRQQMPLVFPQLQLVSRARNGGFAKACNSGFEVCRFPLIALLNNDVLVEESYLNHLAEHFSNDEVFAVTARVFEFEPPRFATGGKVGRFRRGFWSVYFNYDLLDQDRRPEPMVSAYAVGGFAMYDRLKLEQLGGFNELLSPFHWEDVDLSYRAWKRGWRVEYEPRSIGYHRISATIDAHYEKRHVETLAVRNRLIFHWINLHSKGFWVHHCLMLLVLIVTRIWAGDIGFYRALWGALRRLGEISRLRRQERLNARRSDRDLAGLLASFYQQAPIRIFRGRADVDAHGPAPPSSSATPGRP